MAGRKQVFESSMDETVGPSTRITFLKGKYNKLTE